MIIDEAGYAMELDTLMPLAASMDSVKAVMLVGDIHQFRPTVLCKGVAGLDVSLMERLIITGMAVCPLKEQHRMNYGKYLSSINYNQLL